ncbi:LuxR family transcriptional regulator [Streptomyces sp. SID13031]|uniref:helix-turn-helix transcriptional regulator n=1 Tax=Streptomyces sp. SID13031 TaxID=2706046 RepID=UPI0013C6D69A|nr:LuxR family transcriptional regulator [Streptomyces sp. SID13031]NEA32989.1 AAA family ATPase [Streptomyces sp. SID13031]
MASRAGELVGRQAEVDSINAALADARSGTATAVFVVGEPGIGKTRLAAHAIGVAVDSGMVVLRGRVSTIGPITPYRPVIEALLSLSRSGQLPTADELGSYGSVLAHLVPEIGAGQETAASSPMMIAEALLRLLSACGHQRGCLFVLDDLHDADAETLAIVEFLLDNLDTQPAALLLTARSEPCVATDLASAARQRGSALIVEPRRLSPPEVRQLAGSRLEVAAGQVPDAVVERLVTDSAGVPFVIEELVYELTRSGQLVTEPDGCHLVQDAAEPTVPATVARNISRRTDRLGPYGRSILTIAAVVGQRFPLPILRQATGLDDRDLLATLHAGVAAQLVRPDEPAPDWYAFRHPLTAEALLSDLNPTDRAVYSGRVADAVEQLYPELPDEWCARVAQLRERTGDFAMAARRFAEAGRRALAEGAVSSAVALLVRADDLLAPAGSPDERADVLESLLLAVGESGEFDRMPGLTEALDVLTRRGVPAPRRAALHAQLANIANMAGHMTEAVEQIGIARRLLGDDPAGEDSARVDVIAAHVELSKPSSDRLEAAASLARRAASTAEQAGLPIVACDALQLVGYLTRDRDEEAAQQYFEQARQLAETHRLPIFRVYSEVFLARADCLRDGGTAELEQARRSALRMGILPLAYDAGGILALQQVMRWELPAAQQTIETELAAAVRLRLGRAVPFFRLLVAVSHAHHGQRAEMELALDQVRMDGDGAPYIRATSYGLARAFCSLLEEDGERAAQELAQAREYDAENPSMMDFGKYGLIPLLGVLAGRIGWQHYRSVTELSASRTRWNTQFIQLAHAVLLGRAGRPDEANAAAASALRAAELYPMAAHLGLRLVAQSAYDDGWGEPVEWLRKAEEFFHHGDLPVVASACRGLLRGMGAPIRQRRAGADELPPELRRLGVTMREFEVGRLLAERIGNKAIAARLHISPRTVEKHVANVLLKTDHCDREAFAANAPGLFSNR